MKKYDSYKDSGVEWIGEVPSHWEVLPLKFKSDIIMGQSPDGKDIVPFGKTLFMQGNADFNNYYPTPNMYCDSCSKYSRINDILMSVRAPVGELNFSDKIYGIGRGLCSIKGVDVYQKYLWYYLQMTKDIYKYFETGSTFTAITISVIKNLKLIDPSKEEQHKIAYYLDTKCGEVDKVISTQQKRIALLQELKQSIITHAVTKGLNPNVKMKDSGIEWIGGVPEHWKIIRMKYICEFNGRIGFRGYSQADLVSEGEGAITLSPTNMNDMYVDYNKCSYLSWKKYYESPEIMVKQGDVLLVKTASVGKCSYVKTIPMECTVNPQILVLKKHRQNPMFLTYLFQISLGQTYIELYKAGSTIPTLSEDKIGNFRFAFPSDNEQNEIVSYLDKRCSSIDASISKAQREIELLQEYKQSLITEVVTGKRKVC